MKEILKLIESLSPEIKGETVYISNRIKGYEIDMTCNFEDDKHEIVIYDIKKDEIILINNKYWNKIITYCQTLLENDKRYQQKVFTNRDRQHQESLIH